MARKITPAEYNEWLEQDGRGFVALEPYVNARTLIRHQCLEGHQWPAIPDAIKKGNGCPQCAGLSKRTADEWTDFLAQDGRGFLALEPYVNAHTAILHQCPEGHQWRPKPNNIKHGAGCSHCGGLIPQDYTEWLNDDGRGFVALEPYVNNDTRILHQCPEGHQWLVVPRAIKNGNGCPDCSEKSSDANVFYIWENALDAGVYKVGITSERCADKRIGGCAGKNKMKANIVLMIAVRDARDIERRALEMGESVDYPTSIDGHTEFRRYTDHELGKVYQLAVRSA